MKEQIMFDELIDDIAIRIDPAGHNTDGLKKHYRLKLSILVNQEVEKRIKERMPSEEEIEKAFTTEHYHWEQGRHYRVRKDRIFGAKWLRSRLTKPGAETSQKTEGGGE